MAWCIYNVSGPFLLLWHRLFHNRMLTLWVNFWAVASSLIVLAIVILIWIILPPEFNYGQVSCPQLCQCLELPAWLRSLCVFARWRACPLCLPSSPATEQLSSR